ncbi:Bug family tripartite tricarboxylate transporter substrate binding protein [Larsenimonas salina]|uniref:Bug family tripartite tricarboxylate transporter substrate binding protein n=1 Tax=Larsenimonas salina TaxID=1295565 RepID=UPI002072DC0B|nr:tripartite tricarboxylate transporter substrate-binding protein [Larsenimonas salina]MCM5705129.1 tripartite tricarboxylate transporter substrate-binding protein [Larsenimonas salina]
MPAKHWISAVCLAAFVSPLCVAAEQPENRLECLAPADPGGGWDFTCRQFAASLRSLGITDKSMQTINMAGAAGGVAYAHVVSKRNGNDGTIVAASSSNAIRLAQNQYPGMTSDDVTWLGALGADYAVLAVRQDSKLHTLQDMFDALSKNIKSVKFSGGSGVLGLDQVNLLRVLSKGGIDSVRNVTYLDFNNGANAITQVLGGHLDVVSGDISEVSSFIESGDLRVLAVLSDKRLPPPLDNLPTAREQGVDVVAPNWRGFYAPAGISASDKKFWTDAIDTVYQSDHWKEIMRRNGLVPFHMTGDEFENFVKDQIASLNETMQMIK